MITERRSFLKYNGKNIIFNDYSDLQGDAFLEVVEKISVMAKGESMPHRLVLVNATNAIMDKKILKSIKEMMATSSQKIDRTAIYGLSGIQLFFLRTISKFAKADMRPFENREDALEWLTS